MSAVPADRDHPGERDADLDAAFAEIVAGWDDDPSPPVPPWPAVEDVDPEPTSMEQLRLEGDRSAKDEPTPGSVPPSGPLASTAQEATTGPIGPLGPLGPPTGPASPGPRDWELAAQPDEHYQPPEPPPLPRGDLAGQLAWAGLLLGPAFLLFAALFWRDVGQLWIAVAAAAFVGGFVALVVRLPATRGDDDDDGAVV